MLVFKANTELTTNYDNASHQPIINHDIIKTTFVAVEGSKAI